MIIECLQKLLEYVEKYKIDNNLPLWCTPVEKIYCTELHDIVSVMIVGKQLVIKESSILYAYLYLHLPDGEVKTADDAIKWLTEEIDNPREVVSRLCRPIKPPIGVMPREMYDRISKEQRINDLDGAIYRYKRVGMEPSSCWIIERDNLLEELKRL
jgi:hypothetical protein